MNARERVPRVLRRSAGRSGLTITRVAITRPRLLQVSPARWAVVASVLTAVTLVLSSVSGAAARTREAPPSACSGPPTQYEYCLKEGDLKYTLESGDVIHLGSEITISADVQTEGGLCNSATAPNGPCWDADVTHVGFFRDGSIVFGGGAHWAPQPGCFTSAPTCTYLIEGTTAVATPGWDIWEIEADVCNGKMCTNSETQFAVRYEGEECTPASTPVNSLTTPQPPADRAKLASLADPGAILAKAAKPEQIKPEFCSYRAKYTKAEKDAAHAWAIYDGLESARLSKVAAGFGVGAAASTAIPEPTVSKVEAAGLTILAGMAAWEAAEYSEDGTLMSSIEHDPPAGDWRSIASKPVLHKNGLPKLSGAGLSRSQQAAVSAYLVAEAQTAANDACETESINRAMTALANENKAIAAAQYKAGASCATANVAIAKGLPRLTAQVKPALAALVKHLKSAPAKRFLAQHLKTDEQSKAFRKRAAARTIASLTRMIALPKALLTQLEHSLQTPVKASASTPAKTFQAPPLPSLHQDAAWQTLQEQTAQVLGAAAAN